MSTAPHTQSQPDNATLTERMRQGLLEEYFAEIIALKSRVEELTKALEFAKDYVDRAIASYVGDPADNQFQRGHLAALEVVRDKAFSTSPSVSLEDRG